MKPKKITKDNVHKYYYCYNPARIITKTTIYQHKTAKLSSKSNRGIELSVGTPVDIAKVHFDKAGIVPYFELANGTFITANRNMVTNAYYESPLKEIKVLHRIKLYRDLQRTGVVSHNGNTWSKGTEFTVKKIVTYKGSWLLKLDNGFYCTAYKQYVKKIK